jgi:hypothetical protein
MFDADEILEEIYKKYDINWNFVIGRKVNFFKLKHHIKNKCIQLVEAQDNPIVITTEEVHQWLLRHVKGSFDFIEQKDFESVDEYDRSRTVIEFTTFDYNSGVEQYVWYKGFKNNYNIYYLLELEGFNVNIDINRILANNSFISSMKNDAKSYIQYKAQYDEKLAEKVQNSGKYAFRGIGGVLVSATNNAVARAITERYRARLWNDEKGRKYSYRKLIVFVLEMRDFPSAFEYMDEYDAAFPDGDFDVKSMKTEIEKLLSEMEEESKKLDETNIICNWIDNVQNSKLCEMPWVEAQVNSGIRMENAYTAMPWTTWVGRTMFAGENPISGRLYKKENIGGKGGEYPLYDYLINHGYQVYHSCVSSRGTSMFKREHRCEPDINYPDGISTRYQWFGICELLKNKSKTFVILHSLTETHPPFVTMGLDYAEWRTRDRIPEETKALNRRYLDEKILKWYSRFYGERTIKVWMGDHGNIAYNYDVKKRISRILDYFEEERTHVFLGVSGPEIKKIRENRYFEFDGFMPLIKYLIEKNEADYEKMFKPYVVYENYALYSESTVNYIVSHGSVEDLKKDRSTWQQFLGVRDEKYLYILYYDGSESFYVLPDEKKDELENPAYAEPLASFRSLVDGKKFINIFEESKFEHSRKLYEKIGVHEHIWR